ncbi:MAG: glycosyltransferase family 2 protein [Pyrinomonadaceae bacterium]
MSERVQQKSACKFQVASAAVPNRDRLFHERELASQSTFDDSSAASNEQPREFGNSETSGTQMQAGEASCAAATVSVIIPCFNEERFIGKVLENLARQYDGEKYEIIVVDGMSTDRTREVVAEFAAQRAKDVRVRLIDNPARNIPVALNTGIKEARGEIIVRMDAHSVPSINYVRRCVELINGQDAAVVGMPWCIRPGAESRAARAVALAVSHPFGIGDAKYRSPKSHVAQFVDTVPFGVFRKSLWQELGGFNEKLLANEDYDFNYRVRERGGRILLDASEHCEYFARATMAELAKQYFRYGSWKAQMVKLHPRSIKLRQLVAPVFVATLVLLAALSLWWMPALWLLAAVIMLYTSLAILCAVQLARARGEGFDLKLVAAISLAFFVIHSFWGSGFLSGLMRTPR